MMTLLKQFLRMEIKSSDLPNLFPIENSHQPLRWHMIVSFICAAFAGPALMACSPSPRDAELDASSNSENQSDIAGDSEVNNLPNLSGLHPQMRKGWFNALKAYNSSDTVQAELRQIHSHDLITVGRTDIAIRGGIFHPSQSICVRNQNDDGLNAVDKILSLADDHNVIIINEDHNMPRDRAFILNLLAALRSRGFTHYAAETFSEQAIKSVSPFILVGDGTYTNEPIFGRLATKAKTLGYELVAYEMTMNQMLAHTGMTLEEILANSEINIGEVLADNNSSIAEKIEKREIAQSENLIKNLLRKSPDAKVIVHVGHSHASEIPENGHRWMAARLKDKTGLDPLTISQTHCQSDGTDVYVATDAVNKEGANQVSFTDLLIAHPPLTFEKNRPLWRRVFGDKEVEVPSQFLGKTEPILIEARMLNQPDSAVPVERLLLRPEETEIPLLLPPGVYRIEAFNSNGKFSEMEQIEVK